MNSSSVNIAFPSGQTIHRWFEEQVMRTPERIAVIHEEGSITYGELNRRANRLARSLRKAGVGPDRIVAIMTERSLEMVVGLFGILKAGGAYLPIDPRYPSQRIRFMLEDSRAEILLVSGSPAVEAGEVTTIDLRSETAYEETDDSDLEPPGMAADLAYVIYTSGSTGQPKGVMIEHQSVINRLLWMQQAYPIGEHDVILQKTPFCFDVSVWELFWWSMVGAKVCMLVPQGEQDVETIVRTIARRQVTTMHFVPSMLYAFVDYLENNGVPEGLRSLRRVFASGEALPAQLVNRFNRLMRANGTALINLYGPTEATVDVSYFDCSSERELNLVPIGKPIDNIRLYVVEGANRLMPVGVSGELCISGVGLARGYWNRQALTEEKFVPNPFEPGERMYRTGDLARLLPDGNIEYLGRIDHQVKIRGYRIELGEIEARLHRHPSIKEAVVIDCADSQGMPFLCAYLVASDEVSIAAIKRFLSDDLPEYMIPSRFVRLERMPLTPNGKLDRRSLPQPIAERVAEERCAPPRDETESFLVGQWSKLLEVEEVGIHDHFFELGGNSLQIQQLKMNIVRSFGVSVSMADILRHPTPAELAQRIRGQDREEPLPPLERVPAKPYYRLSDAQNRMYVLYEMNPASTIWNMPGAMYIRGAIDRDRLERCFREVIRRHESLRTSFERIDGLPVQRVIDDFAFELRHGEVDADHIDHTLASFIQPFPLHAAPLVRAGLFRINEQEQTHLLVVDIHHIVFDGASIGILFHELGALYNAESGLEAPYPYKDFAEWEQAWRNSASYRKQERFWHDVFQAAASPLQLPTDYPRPARRTTEGEQLDREFPAELTASLRRFARETETTLYMVLVACFSILLSKYSGQEDIVVGSFVSGRTHPDTTHIVGMFVNTLPIRSYPNKEKTLHDYLDEVKQFTLAALENQNYPFAELTDWLRKQPDWHPEWMRAMFTLQNTEHAKLKLAGAEVVPYPVRFPYAGMDLSLQAEEAGDRLRFTLNYSTQLFRGSSMDRLFDHYAGIVEAVMRNPGLRIRDLSLEPSNTQLEMQDLTEVTFDF